MNGIDKNIITALVLEEQRAIAQFDKMPNVEFEFSEAFLHFLDDLKERSRKGVGYFRWTAKKIAALVAALVLILSLTACAIKPIRNFFVEVFTKETRLSMECDEQFNQKLFTINTIPSGYEKSNEVVVDKMHIVEYTSGNNLIRFKYIPVSATVISLDSEGAELKIYEINGACVRVALKNERFTSVWTNGDYSFALIAPESIGWDGITAILESVCEVNTDD